jgi:DNA-binding MarR family transcriptional regulator
MNDYRYPTVTTSRFPETAGTVGPSTSECTTQDAAQIVSDVQRAAHLLRSVLSGQLAEFGLNDIRHAVLKMLQEATETGCTQAQLAERLDQSESSISTLIRRMRGDGLVYRMRPRSDQRKRLLFLTERGRELLARSETSHADRMTSLLTTFDQTESRQLKNSLSRLVTKLVEVRRAEKGSSRVASGQTDHVRLWNSPSAETSAPAA